MTDEAPSSASGAAPVVRDESALLEKNRQLLEETKAAKAESAAFKHAMGGHDATQIAQLIAERKQKEEDLAKKAGEYDKLLDKRVKEEREPLLKEIDGLKSYKTKYEDREVDLAIREAAGKAGVIAEDVKHVIKLVKGDRIRYDEKTAKVVVLDGDGDVSGITVEKFFSETFKTEAPKFYQGTIGSGGGATPGSGGSRGHSGPVDKTDQAAFLANMDKIATGELKVA